MRLQELGLCIFMRILIGTKSDKPSDTPDNHFGASPIADLEGQINQLLVEIQTLTDANNAVDEGLANNLTTAQNEIDELQNTVDELTSMYEELEGELSSLQDQICESCLESDLPRDCNEILQQNPGSGSGYYTIYTESGDDIEVFCDFYGTRGYMFISHESLTKLNSFDGFNLLRDHAIIRVLYTDGAQHDVKISQIMTYQSWFPLSFQINQADGYKLPKNVGMTPYIYLGFIPSDVAMLKSRTGGNPYQGYMAGDNEVLFQNCDQNPNSYIAFFGNENGVSENNYWTGCCNTPTVRGWFMNDQPIPSSRYLLPEDFFFFEMHMGGCGGYFTTSHADSYGVVGATLGLGFDIKSRC